MRTNILHAHLYLYTNFPRHGYRYRSAINIRGSSTTTTSCSGENNTTDTAPWQLTPYFTKKKKRPLDAQGNIIGDTLENTAEWFALSTNEAKLRLAADTLSSQLDVPAQQLIENATKLGAIVPGGPEALDAMKPADIIRLAAQIDSLPAQWIALRAALPPALDLNRISQKWPAVLLLSPPQAAKGFRAVADQFEGACGREGVIAMLQTSPQLLDTKMLEECMRGASHLMPLAQLASSLTRYGDYYLQFQSLENEPRND